MQKFQIQNRESRIKIQNVRILHTVCSRLSKSAVSSPKQKTAFSMFLLCKCEHFESRFESLESKFGTFEYFIRYVVDFQNLLSVLQKRKQLSQFPYSVNANISNPDSRVSNQNSECSNTSYGM